MQKLLEAGKTITRVGLRVTQAILMAVYAIVALLCRIIGVRPPAPPQLPLPDMTPSVARERVQDSFEAAMARDLEPVHDLGRAVHQYAAAPEPWVRAAVDLTGLSPQQFAWLMSLTDSDLQRLAAAGPAACQRAAEGKRSGVVGLPQPRPLPVPEPVAEDPRERARALLRERIHGTRKQAAADVAA